MSSKMVFKLLYRNNLLSPENIILKSICIVAISEPRCVQNQVSPQWMTEGENTCEKLFVSSTL